MGHTTSKVIMNLSLTILTLCGLRCEQGHNEPPQAQWVTSSKVIIKLRLALVVVLARQFEVGVTLLTGSLYSSP